MNALQALPRGAAAVPPALRAALSSARAVRHVAAAPCGRHSCPLGGPAAGGISSQGSTGEQEKLTRGVYLRRRYQWGRVAAAEEGGSVATADSSVPEAAKEPEDPKVVEGLDIRVGKILKAWKHPEADSLYVEEVDIGEETGPRTICSGLVKYVAEEEMQDRSVLVLANLKPRNMRGVKSNGMLLAASDKAHENVELLIPPEGSQPGERVWFGGEEDGGTQAAPAAPNQLQKKKVWEAVQPHLNTSEEGVARFLDRPMRVSGGVVKSKSLKGGNIS